MAGGSAAASVGSAVIFAAAVASRARRHCVAGGRAGSALYTAVVPGGLVELLLRWLYGA
eukprot:COSAG01_NODE_43087_length_433_cov_1.068862_1_plen_58_part_10